jgi:methyl-accepting chemotaxis protein
MGIDPATTDHVVDAVDQQIEAAAARVETLIAAAEGSPQPLATDAQAAIEKLRGAMEEVEQAIERVDAAVLADEARPKTAAAANEASPETQAVVEGLDRAAQRFTDVVQDVGNIVAGTQDGSRDAKDAGKVEDAGTNHEPVARPAPSRSDARGDASHKD